MKYTILSYLFFVMAISPVYSQKEKMGNLMNDMDEEESGNFTLRFSNALNGDAVDDATITFDDGQKYTTGAEGKITFKKIDNDGKYSFTFSKDGFIGVKLDFEVLAGTIFYNTFSVSPSLKLGAVRIVLEWGAEPHDLDAHLLKEGSYHISYRDKIKAEDGTAKLDIDAKHGHGPETVTIYSIDNNARYTFYVNDYSNKGNSKSTALGKSKAVVRIYENKGLLREFKIDPLLTGDKWNVFTIENGNFKY